MTTPSFDERSAEVKEHERRAAVILDGMYQFVALLSPSGEILEVNRAALEGAGHQIQELRVLNARLTEVDRLKTQFFANVGGTVRVDSVLGEGSTFTVTIPFGTEHLDLQRIGQTPGWASTAIASSAFAEEAWRWLPDESRKPSGQPAVAPALASADGDRPGGQPAGSRARVLWADDNADMRDYVSHLLGGRFDVQTVADGHAALEAVRAHPPDLVLSDVMMPRLDGFGALRALRADPQLREIPVILLSARAGEASHLEGLIGRVGTCGQPEWCVAVATDPTFHRRHAAQEAGLKAGIAVPILVGTSVVGVLEFYADEPLAPNPTLLDATTQMGTQLGRAIERERAAAQTERQQEALLQQEKLGAMSTMLASVAHELNNPPHQHCIAGRALTRRPQG